MLSNDRETIEGMYDVLGQLMMNAVDKRDGGWEEEFTFPINMKGAVSKYVQRVNKTTITLSREMYSFLEMLEIYPTEMTGNRYTPGSFVRGIMRDRWDLLKMVKEEHLLALSETYVEKKKLVERIREEAGRLEKCNDGEIHQYVGNIRTLDTHLSGYEFDYIRNRVRMYVSSLVGGK